MPFFKVFLGRAPPARARRRVPRWRGRPPPGRSLLVAVPCALATAALALGQGGETVRVVLAPLDLARITRETLGLAPLAGMRTRRVVGRLARRSRSGCASSALPAAFRSLRGPAPASALGAMALAGWPLGLALPRLGARGPCRPEDRERRGLPRRAVGAAALGLRRHRPRGRRHDTAAARGRRGRAPPPRHPVDRRSTWRRRRGRRPTGCRPPMVRAVRALERVSRPGRRRPAAARRPLPARARGARRPARALRALHAVPHPVRLARRRLEARHEVVYRFFRTTSRDEALAIARSLDARFLALYGRDRVRFDTTGVLEPVHEEEGARVYRILGLP